MSEYIFVPIACIFIVVLSMVLSVLILMIKDLLVFVGDYVIEKTKYALYSVGEWMRKMICNMIKRIAK